MHVLLRAGLCPRLSFSYVAICARSVQALHARSDRKSNKEVRGMTSLRKQQPRGNGASVPTIDFQRFGKSVLAENGVPLGKSLEPLPFDREAKMKAMKLAYEIAIANQNAGYHLSDIPLTHTAKPACAKSALISAANSLGRQMAAEDWESLFPKLEGRNGTTMAPKPGKNGHKVAKSGKDAPAEYQQLASLRGFIKETLDRLASDEATGQAGNAAQDHLGEVRGKLEADLKFLDTMLSFVSVQAEKISDILMSMLKKEWHLEQRRAADIAAAKAPQKTGFIPWLASTIKYILPTAFVATATDMAIALLKNANNEITEFARGITEKFPSMLYIGAGAAAAMATLGTIYGVYSYTQKRKREKEPRIHARYDRKISKLERCAERKITWLLTYVNHKAQVEMLRTGYFQEMQREMPASYFLYGYTGNFSMLTKEYYKFSDHARHPSAFRDFLKRVGAVFSHGMHEELEFERRMRRDAVSLAGPNHNGAIHT